MTSQDMALLAYLLRQQVGDGAETAETARRIGKIDRESFEADQALAEVEAYQDRQFAQYVASFECD